MIAFGVDGCRGGWFVVRLDAGRVSSDVVPRLDDLVLEAPEDAPVFIDIPIGLHDDQAGPRGCDVIARQKLGPRRRASVFPAPLRPVLNAPDYVSALAISRALCGKGLTKQTFNIVPKIREIDELLAGSPKARTMLREVHPEVCFWAFNGGQAMHHRKKDEAGFIERMRLIEKLVPGARTALDAALARFPRKVLARDDVVDALAVAATAATPREQLATFPEIPTRDSRGLPMEMVFSAAQLAPQDCCA